MTQVMYACTGHPSQVIIVLAWPGARCVTIWRGTVAFISESPSDKRAPRSVRLPLCARPSQRRDKVKAACRYQLTRAAEILAPVEEETWFEGQVHTATVGTWRPSCQSLLPYSLSAPSSIWQTSHTARSSISRSCNTVACRWTVATEPGLKAVSIYENSCGENWSISELLVGEQCCPGRAAKTPFFASPQYTRVDP